MKLFIFLLKRSVSRPPFRNIPFKMQSISWFYVTVVTFFDWSWLTSKRRQRVSKQTPPAGFQANAVSRLPDKRQLASKQAPSAGFQANAISWLPSNTLLGGVVRVLSGETWMLKSWILRSWMYLLLFSLSRLREQSPRTYHALLFWALWYFCWIFYRKAK